MSTISLRLPDTLLREIEKRASELHVSKAEYIRRALEAMNLDLARKQRDARLKALSPRVREESMRINAEFATIEDAPDA